MKSTVAARAIKQMNPEINVIAHQNRVGPETEGILSAHLACIYIYMCMYVCVCVHTYNYVACMFMYTMCSVLGGWNFYTLQDFSTGLCSKSLYAAWVQHDMYFIAMTFAFI